MAQFFDYDPLTGVKETFDYDESTGKAYIHATQNVGALVDQCKALANSGDADAGIKKGLWLYAEVPSVIQMQMLNDGVNPHPRTKDEWRRLFREIDSKYPYLKTTHKKHS